MGKLNLKYLTPSSANTYSFYRIPQELLDNSTFDSINAEAKLLYVRMLSRSDLSRQRPDFTDKNGRVYIVYTIEEIMQKCRRSRQTVINMLKQLHSIGLITKKRRGQGKASLIYVMDFSSANFEKSTNQTFEDADFQKSKKYTSRSLNSRLPEVKNLDPNLINPSKPDQSEINLSVKESTADKEIAEVIEVKEDRLTDKKTEISNRYEEIRSVLGKTEKEKVSGLDPDQHQIPGDTDSSAAAPEDQTVTPHNIGEGANEGSYHPELLTRELIYDNGDLSIFASDAKKMHTLVNTLIDNSCTANAQNNHTVSIVKQAVLQILCSGTQNIKINKDNFIRYSDVLAKFSEFIDVSSDNVRFSWFAAFIEQFSQKLPQYQENVKSMIPYAKAAVLHYLYFEYDDKARSDTPAPSSGLNNDSDPAPFTYQNDPGSSFNVALFVEKSILCAMRPESMSEQEKARLAQIRAAEEVSFA